MTKIRNFAVQAVPRVIASNQTLVGILNILNECRIFGVINLPVLLLHLDFLGLLLSVVVPIILHLNYVIIPSVFFTLHAPAAIFSEAAAITNFDAPSTHRYEKKTEGDKNDRIGDAGVF